MPVRRRTLAIASTLVALSLALAACGGDDKQQASSDEPTDSTNTASALSLNGEWPLTGEKLEGDLPDHPVYVVKIDNTSNSAPQIGLGSADMVVEELVEGGLTRLAAFYYEKTPDLVGPVRSMRASDIGIVKPMEAVIVAAGGARPTKQRVAAAGISDLGEDSPGFERNSSRSVPYNLFAHLSQIADDPTGQWKPPPGPYFEFGEGNFTTARSVSKITAQFSASHTTDWVYTKTGWTRPGSNAQSGHEFAADNILLLRVRQGDAGYKDPAGNPVPETLFFGAGDAVLVHGDKALPCRWKKHDRKSQLRLTTKAGNRVEVPPGHMFIELVPGSTGEVTLTK
jgi:DUF3048 family protein